MPIDAGDYSIQYASDGPGVLGSGQNGYALTWNDSTSHIAASPLSIYLLSASYTAADVFAKVLALDGSGSGLDADTVRATTPGAFGLTVLGAANLAAAGFGTMATATEASYLLTDGSRTGATIQAQFLSKGVILQRDSALLLSNALLDVRDQTGVSMLSLSRGGTVDGKTDLRLSTDGNVALRMLANYAAWGGNAAFMQFGNDRAFFTATYGVALARFSISSAKTVITSGRYDALPSPINVVDIYNGAGVSTNNIDGLLSLYNTSSGTPVAGFGASLDAYLKSSTTVGQAAGRLTWQWSTATHASRASKGQLSAYYTSTERPTITWGADSSNPLLSFYDVTTPIARQLLATGASHTVDDVITALQALGLVKQS